MVTVKDIFGVEVGEGDTVAVGMSLGQSSVLRVGKIRGIKETEGYRGRKNYSVSVNWTHTGSGRDSIGYGGTKSSTIQVKGDHSYAKLVKLDADYVNQFPVEIVNE